MTCASCGLPVDAGERFCGECGQPVQPPKPPAVMFVLVLLLVPIGIGVTWWLSTREPAAIPAGRGPSSFKVFTNADPSERLKALHAGLTKYADEHGGVIPAGLEDANRLRETLRPYITEDDTFTDPRFNRPFPANPAVAGLAVRTVTSDPVLFCGAGAGTDGYRTAITLAGVIRAVPPAECGVR